MVARNPNPAWTAVSLGAGIFLGLALGRLLTAPPRGASLQGAVEAPARPPAPGAPSDDASVEAAALTRRLEQLEERLADAEREVINFQIYVHRQAAPAAAPSHEAAPATTGTQAYATSPPAPAADPRPDLGGPRQAPGWSELSPAALFAQMGPADVEPREDGGQTVRFWEGGARAELGPDGQVQRLVLFGVPAADWTDANGNMVGLFGPTGAWYRPQRWRLDGVDVGMLGIEVATRLGPPDAVDYTANGEAILRYPQRHLAVVLGWGPEYRVERLELVCGDGQ